MLKFNPKCFLILTQPIYLMIQYLVLSSKIKNTCNQKKSALDKAIFSVIGSSIQEIFRLHYLYLFHMPSLLMGDFKTVMYFFNLANLK